MANYRYNGIELPALPVLEGYPYAAIFELSTNSYYVYFAKIPWVAKDLSNGTVQLWLDDSVSDEDDAPYYRFTDGAWEYRGEHVSWGILNGVNSSQRLRDLRWCNSDILWATETNGTLEYGDVCYEGSDPVPLVPTLTARDLYRKINGKPTKLTLYKKVGGKLIPLDEHTKEVKT